MKEIETDERPGAVSFRRALSAAEIGVWIYDYAKREAFVDERTAAFFGMPPRACKLPLDAFFDAIHPEDADAVAVAMAGKGPFNVEFRVNAAGEDASRWLRASGWRDDNGDDGDSGELAGVTQDVTSERADREALELLIAEMRHRVGNLFSILGGLIAIKAAETEGVADLAETLRGQLSALAEAHSLSLGDDPRQDHVTFEELTRALARPFVLRPESLELSGPPIEVGPVARTTVSLLLYEWFTNALKYGALSTRDGRVELKWRLEDGAFRLSWRERGGPKVARPKSVGFGDRLQTAALKRLGGDATFDWPPEGVSIEARASLTSLAA